MLTLLEFSNYKNLEHKKQKVYQEKQFWTPKQFGMLTHMWNEKLCGIYKSENTYSKTNNTKQENYLRNKERNLSSL